MILLKSNEINIFSIYYSQMLKLDNSTLEINLINTISQEVKAFVFTYELFKTYMTFTCEPIQLSEGDWTLILLQNSNEIYKEKIII